MGYWDFAPPSGHHSKKPLTRSQIKKLQQAYANAGAITEEVKSLEKEEQMKTKNEIENDLQLLF